MQIKFSPAAVDDLIIIGDWYKDKGGNKLALSMLKKIRSSIEHLANNTLMARNGRVDGTYEKVIVGTEFIAVYIITDRVETVRVLHSAQQWP